MGDVINFTGVWRGNVAPRQILVTDLLVAGKRLLHNPGTAFTGKHTFLLHRDDHQVTYRRLEVVYALAPDMSQAGPIREVYFSSDGAFVIGERAHDAADLDAFYDVAPSEIASDRRLGHRVLTDMVSLADGYEISQDSELCTDPATL